MKKQNASPVWILLTLIAGIIRGKKASDTDGFRHEEIMVITNDRYVLLEVYLKDEYKINRSDNGSSVQ